eukprot:10623800-Prorocentrum_lima.AAC.1
MLDGLVGSSAGTVVGGSDACCPAILPRRPGSAAGLPQLGFRTQPVSILPPGLLTSVSWHPLRRKSC